MNAKGFTLIEAIVATSVFAVAATSIVGVYASIQRLNRQSSALQALEQNVRFVGGELTKIIEAGKIDYASYAAGTVAQPFTTDLYLRDHNQTQLRIFKSGDFLALEKAGVGTANLTGREIKVLNFRLYIWPATNPFPEGPATPKEQPTVTIYVDLQSNLGGENPSLMTFQTTIATREYPQ